METDNKFEKAFSEKTNWKILNKIHTEILSLGAEVSYIIYPIYIKYFYGDNVIAVVFLKSGGSHMQAIDKSQVDLGLNVAEKPQIKGFRTAEYMKDKNINFSILLSNSDTPKTVRSVVKSLVGTWFK